jgi:hypothetical protein
MTFHDSHGVSPIRIRPTLPLDGPFKRPGWFARAMRWLGWIAGSQ